MKLQEVKKEIQKYQHLEDTGIIGFSLASIVSNHLKLESPVWSVIIGLSSGGKSQILRPISIADDKFIHRVDDLTENTFLSGAKSKEGDNSLLNREGGIGKHGMIAISDLTVLMSKSGESRATILSQFRMLYDGEMIKHSGNQKEPLKWNGYLGIIAGSTPTIYSTFEEVSDMGERFIYYRMKEFDRYKATKLALNRTIYGKDLDEKLADIYGAYIKEVIQNADPEADIKFPEEIEDRIIKIAIFAETIRTTSHKDWQGNQDRISIPAYPMRVAQQLRGLGKALAIMKHHDTGSYELGEEEMKVLEWTGYSLANEENRACLRILASLDFNTGASTQAIADEIGLNTDVVRIFLQNLSAVGILKRSGGTELKFKYKDKEQYDFVRKIENLHEIVEIEEREVVSEEEKSMEESAKDQFNSF